MVESPHDEPTQILPAALPVTPARRRRHWLLFGAAAALAVVLLAGIGWAVLYHPAPPATTSGPPASSSSRSVKSAGHKMRGTILTESGSTWTLRSSKGQTVTVMLTDRTAFGSTKHPSTAADFPVGATVAVTGTVDHGTVTATRVSLAAAVHPSPSASA